MDIQNFIYKVLTPSGSGSAFMISGYKFLITNYHVVEGFFRVAIEDIEHKRYEAKVIMLNKALDLAFLYVEDFKDYQSPIRLNKNLDLDKIQKVNIYGYPFGMSVTKTSGIVSSYNQLFYGNKYIQTDAAVNPGNSGGAMLNEDNELVGIVCSKITDADNVGFAIRYIEFCDELNLYNFDIDNLLVKCSSCKSYVSSQEKYCLECGSTIEDVVYEVKKSTYIEEVIDGMLTQMGINPVLCRVDYEYWNFYYQNALIRIFLPDNDKIIITSPLCLLPDKDMESVLEYIVSYKEPSFMLGIYGLGEIYLSYRVYQEHLYNKDFKSDVLSKFIKMIQSAPKIQEKLMNVYKCREFLIN